MRKLARISILVLKLQPRIKVDLNLIVLSDHLQGNVIDRKLR